MTAIQGHSILFDAPVGNAPIHLNNDNVIENINVIYNPKVIRTCLQLYMVLLICQYVASFSSVPFDDVDNRPAICVLSSIYTLLMLVGLLLAISSVVMCLNTEEMYLYEYDSSSAKSVKNNVTTYIQVLACISLAINALGFFLSLLNAILASTSLRNLNNKINRQTLGEYTTNMSEKLPKHISTELFKSFVP